MKVFAVHDSKAEAFLQPFFSQTVATALRSFAQAAQDEQHQFHTHAGDYSLFQIAEYDEQTGRIKPLDSNVLLGNALEYLNAQPASNGALRQMEIV